MKTFTNHTITLHDTQLVVEAIELITNEKVQYNSIDKSSFTVYNYMRITIQTNPYKVDFNSKSIELSDIDSLLNFLLIQTTLTIGLSHLHDRGLHFNNLNQKEQNRIHKMSFYPFFEVADESIYETLVYANNKLEELDLPPKFLRILRVNNRKAIIKNIINEVSLEKKDYLVA